VRPSLSKSSIVSCPARSVAVVAMMVVRCGMRAWTKEMLDAYMTRVYHLKSISTVIYLVSNFFSSFLASFMFFFINPFHV